MGPMNQATTQRRFGTAAVLCVAAVICCLAGCSGGGSGSQQQASSGGFFGLFAKKDPNADLTPEEGQKLLAEIRKDNSRLQKLTPGERRYIARVTAAN